MIFHIANSPQELEVLGAFQERIEGTKSALGFPTVYGVDHTGTVWGFTSTNSSFGAVISGPTVIDPIRKPRLEYAQSQIAAHEEALKRFGVTEYIFSVEKTNKKMLARVSETGLVPYNEDTEVFWYKKLI